MKKYSIALIIFMLLFSIGNASLAACLDNTILNPDYKFTDDSTNPNHFYAVGEEVKTQLSFVVEGKNTSIDKDLSIVLVMDVSGSMSYNEKDTAAVSLNGLVDNIEADDNSSTTRSHEMGLVFFDSNIWPINFYTSGGYKYLINDYTAIGAEVSTMKSRGGGNTDIGGALYSAVNVLNSSSKAAADSEKIIVLVSDGQNTAGNGVQYGINAINSSSSEITAYTIGIGINSTGEQELQNVAASGTGEGAYYYVNNVNKLDEALEDIANKTTSFKITNLKPNLTFNLGNFEYVSSSPLPSNSVAEINTSGLIKWDFGSREFTPIKTGDDPNKNKVFIDLNLRVTDAPASGGEIPVNDQSLEISYVDQTDPANGNSGNNSVVCTATPTPSVPVLRIFAYRKPVVVDFRSNKSSVSDGESTLFKWDTENADKCVASSDDNVWIGSKDAAEPSPGGALNTKQETVNPKYIGQSVNDYFMTCEKTYVLKNGATETAYSNEASIQIQVDPCSPTGACTWESLIDACSSLSCGSPVNRGGTCHLVQDCSGSYGSCADATNAGYSMPSCDPIPGTCPPCREVDKWIEVAP